MPLQTELDLAHDLGYTGARMFVLSADNTFRFDGEHVIACEIVTDENGRVIPGPDNDIVTRDVMYDLPPGWTVIADMSLTKPPTYRLVSPREHKDSDEMWATYYQHVRTT